MLMDSMPPASATFTSPLRIWSKAYMVAFMAEPHILLMVVTGTPSDRPALSTACRPGAWPWPAGSTQPMCASSICAPSTPASATTAAIAAAPRSEADRLANWP